MPDRQAARADDGTWMRMPHEMTGIVKKLTARPEAVPGRRPDRRGGRRPSPKPVAADADSPLWPEGVIVGLVALVAALGVVRVSGRFKPASS